ncbi:MAG TPA: acetylglutamate kinase [Victivallales bacterium]|nr:acetylglutamate kinase [Victivallales bacterium]HPO89937.1 acetylglutamate kinase [Victivallales bacterium]HRR28682.1 acetylglutamate kinase [Victivallales bacterium]HRU01633.1 acetylglutamate kinase [Victivallales bacterium]
MKEIINKASVLIEALPYIQRFKGEKIVIKLGGSVMENDDLMQMTIRDIVFMETVGMKPIIVHGGGKAITAKMNEVGLETKFINGLRYTCEKTIEVVDDVLHNLINSEIVQKAKKFGGKAHPISGKSFLKAKKKYTICSETGKKIDIGFVGEIISVNTKPILRAIKQGLLPVIPPLACDSKKNIYNINADIAACHIAKALKARKLVFISDVPGILLDPKDESTVISTIKESEINDLIKRKIISGGMIPKVESAIEALKAGTNKIHMIDGRIQHSLLLEIFTDKGIGTEIVRG